MNIRVITVFGLAAILFAACNASPRSTVKSKPELRQFSTLKPDDFARHPVWVQCHIIDRDEPWHAETDEETFRPWTGLLPVDPDHAMFLVRATFNLADGTTLTGFVTPSTTQDLGNLQPQLFSESGQRVSFWLGRFPRAEDRNAAYRAVGKTAAQIFPIRFAANDQLCRGVASGTLEGFSSIPDGSNGKATVDK